MSLVTTDYFSFQCDVCDEVLSHSSRDFFEDEETATYLAIKNKWNFIDGEHFCTKCKDNKQKD